MQLLQFSMVVKALTEIHFDVNPHFYNTMFCGQLRLVFLHTFWRWHLNWDAKSANFQICTTLHQTNKTFYPFM